MSNRNGEISMSLNEDKPLLRNKQTGAIAGICAGIADFLHLEVWVIRIVVISVFLLGGAGLIFILYLALWLILDCKPSAKAQSHFSLKKKTYQSGQPFQQLLNDVSESIQHLENKLQHLENYTFSNEFDLKRKINHLSSQDPIKNHK